MSTHPRDKYDTTSMEDRYDSEGRLVVPVMRSIEPTPRRAGWKPWWVNIDLKRSPQKFVTYKKETA